MKNWNELEIGENGYCTSDKDFEDARHIANKLKIDLHQINFSKDYWLEIFRYFKIHCSSKNFFNMIYFSEFIREYEEGKTPNPDILCNRVIKFDKFLKHGLQNLKCDGWLKFNVKVKKVIIYSSLAIATGHYARTSFGDFLENYNNSEKVKLLEAVDTFKDQTFFLSQVDETALRHCMFPLGSMTKNEVKEIAKSIGLEQIAKKNESTGLCFVGRRSFPSFISQFIADKPGNFVDMDSGKVLAKHQGIHYWTLGQRTGLWDLNKNFVCRKDPTTQTIYTVSGTNHPLLFSDIFYTEKPFWIRENPFINKQKSLIHAEFRFQHTKPKTECIVYKGNSDGSKLLIKLKNPLRAITPGQYAVLYKDGECLGSSRIIDSGTGPIKINES